MHLELIQGAINCGLLIYLIDQIRIVRHLANEINKANCNHRFVSSANHLCYKCGKLVEGLK